MKPLTIHNNNHTIDTVCDEFNCNNNDDYWIVRRWLYNNTDTNVNNSNNHQSNVSEVSNTLLYGITLSTLSPSSLSYVDTNNDNTSLSTIATFYIGYSTWDGRILYVDTIRSQYNNNSDSNRLAHDVAEELESKIHEKVLLTIRTILSKIAVQLHCSRFTWQHYSINDPLCQLNYATIPPPSTLKEWITLHWYKESIAKYISNPTIVQQVEYYLNERQQSQSRNNNCNDDNTNKTNDNNQHYASLHNKINFALNIHQQYSTILSTRRNSDTKKKSIVKIRLATTDNDCTSICRLVQQLAIYEKEEHAVHIGKEQYTLDGLLSSMQKNDTNITQNDNDTSTTLPLFFCLLLVEEVMNNTTNNIESEHVFGMAFCYIGYKLINSTTSSTGSINSIQSFVYLEDLYIEESYRKYGYGTYTMECLGIITLVMQCYAMVWSALDWNTSAIEFYTNKIGACIQSNLYTTRYDTTNLSLFVQATNNATDKNK